MTKNNDPILFFNGNKEDKENNRVFSNFYKSKFWAPDINGKIVDFYYSEQYFMYVKSLIFRDDESAKTILHHPEYGPADFKRIGRQLKNYNHYKKTWELQRQKVMYNALAFKFAAPKMKQQLLDTANRQMIEASPFDKLWGAGQSANDLRKKNFHKSPNQRWDYAGQNRQGKLLEQLRSDIVHHTVKIKDIEY